MRAFFLVFVLLLLSCGPKQAVNNDKKVVDEYLPKYSKEEVQQKLNEIAIISNENNRSDSLANFFSNWNKDITTNSAEFINQNDTIKAIFAVFKAVYNPFDLLKLGDWEWGNKLNSACKYVVVQNKFYYSVLKSDTFKNSFKDADGNVITFRSYNSKCSIVNFRPPINFDKSKVLYLTTEYKDAINFFLGTEQSELGEGNIMNPARPIGESEKRYRMLRPFIPILHGHNSGWNIETGPNVSSITLNKSLSIAHVAYSVGYEGGEATLIKSNGDWSIKESHTTWIQ